MRLSKIVRGRGLPPTLSRGPVALRILSAGSAALLAGAIGFAPPAAARSVRFDPGPATSGYVPAESLEGNFLAAYIAGASRDTAAAAAYYREALRADPLNPDILQRAFVSLLADGDYPAANRAAERLSARDPGNGLANLSLAVRAFKAKQYATARNLLARGGRGRAADVTASLLTAWSYAGSGNGLKALEAANGLGGERAFAVFRDYHAGLIADLTGNGPEAERRLKAAYDADKMTLRIADAYARELARRGRTDDAMAVYNAFDSASPRHPLIRLGQDEVAARKPVAQVVSSAQDGAAEVLYGLGSAGVQQGDEIASIVYLRLALQLKPDHPLALITLADVYERMKRTEDAIEVLRRVPAGSPLRPGAEIQIGLDLETLGKGDEALAQLGTLEKQRPDDNDVLVAYGNVLRSRKKYAEAADVYGRAIERAKPGDQLWPLYYYRGTALERAKQWPKAEADLKKALELVPESQPLGRSQVLNYLGYSWVDQNINLDEAFKMLKQAVDLNPRDGMIIDSLGWAYYRFGHYDDAVKQLEKAIELKSGDPVINDHLGDAYWRVGRKLEAKFQWQHAKDSGPEPDDLKVIDEKLANGLPESKPAEAESAPAEPQKSGG